MIMNGDLLVQSVRMSLLSIGTDGHNVPRRDSHAQTCHRFLLSPNYTTIATDDNSAGSPHCDGSYDSRLNIKCIQGAVYVIAVSGNAEGAFKLKVYDSDSWQSPPSPDPVWQPPECYTDEDCNPGYSAVPGHGFLSFLWHAENCFR